NKFGDIWDWHTYYTASVPDAATPARIKIQPRDGGDTLTLKQFDRVTVGAGTSFFRSNVTAVTAEGLVDLEDAPPASSRSGFRIAIVDSNDPIRGIDDRILTEMGPGKVSLDGSASLTIPSNKSTSASSERKIPSGISWPALRDMVGARTHGVGLSRARCFL